MPTPYDAALRVQQRAIDAIRQSLLAELARERALDAACAELDTRIAHESAVAVDWQGAAHPFIAHQRRRRRALDHDRRAVDAGLGELRGAALAACGELQAIVGAAGSYAAARRRDEATAEQRHADDFAGTRIAAARRAAARVPRP